MSKQICGCPDHHPCPFESQRREQEEIVRFLTLNPHLASKDGVATHRRLAEIYAEKAAESCGMKGLTT